VIYSKKHISQATRIQQPGPGARGDGRHQGQEDSKKKPKDYLERLTRKEEEQQNLANAVKNYTIDHFLNIFP